MAGEMRQEWTWRDMFRSIGLAFSFSRLLVGFFGLALMVVSDSLLAWAGYEVTLAGYDITEKAVENAWLVWLGTEVLWYLRVIVLGYLFLGTATAIAYGVKGELLDGEGAGAKESIGFALKKIGTVFWTPVIFWIYILLMAFFGFVWFLLGLIPVAGPAIAAAGWFFVFLFSILAAMGFLAFAFSFFLAPPIIAVRQEGALDAVLDTIDLMRGKGAFWVSILVLAAAMLLGPIFLAKTFDTTYRVARGTMGERFTKTVECMPKEIQPREGTFFLGARRFWPGQYEPHRAMMASSEWTTLRRSSAAANALTRHKVAGWILGIWVLILAGFALSFTLGAFVAAATLTYLIVREEEEFLEPVSVEPSVPAAPAPEKEPAKEEAKPEKKEEKKEEKKPEPKKSKRKSKKQSKRESKKESKSGSDEESK
ncbi:MAG: hypothetical protein ACYS9X_09375 [Planctomycetota bacterium]|jgi:hypothetical protein